MDTSIHLVWKVNTSCCFFNIGIVDVKFKKYTDDVVASTLGSNPVELRVKKMSLITVLLIILWE